MTDYLSDYRLWILVGFIVAGGCGLAFRRRRMGGRPVDNPKILFRDLCWAHDLTRREIALLRSLAVARRLDSPATLFIEPSYFDVATLGPAWEAHAPRIAELRDRLFFSELDEAVTRA